MLHEALGLIINIVFELFMLVVLMRLYMQISRIPLYNNQLGFFLMRSSDWLVLPLRRSKFFPMWGSFDTATFFVVFLTALCLQVLLLLVAGAPIDWFSVNNWVVLIFLSLLKMISQSATLMMGVVIVMAILSWVSPYNGVFIFLERLARPFLLPFRWARIGIVKLDVLILLILLQVILSVPVRHAEMTLLSLLLFL